MIPLAVLEGVTDASGVAPLIEAMLPIGVRARQLLVRTLLLGVLLVLADHRPAHLTRVHHALITLPGDDQARPGVLADRKNGPHRLTCRQAGYTFGLVARALGKDEPGGLPSPGLQAACGQLPEASVPEQFKDASASPAAGWTDLESFSGPRRTAPAAAPAPGPPGDIAGTACCAAAASCSTGTASPPGPWSARTTARRSPNWPGA